MSFDPRLFLDHNSVLAAYLDIMGGKPEANGHRWARMYGWETCYGCIHWRRDYGHWDDSPYCVEPSMAAKANDPSRGVTLAFGVIEPCGDDRKLKTKTG